MKQELFWKQLENVNLCNFSSCDLFHKDVSVSVPFQSIHAVEMIDSLTENFKMRFNGFHSHATIYMSLKTYSLLKSVMLQNNCNLN
jgi:hypothetical protein